MKDKFTMHLLLVLVFSTLLMSRASAQVHSGNLTLSNQAAVDAFNFTEVTGVLTVGGGVGSNVTNLHGLSELTKVGLSLILTGTDVPNLDGLGNLQSVGKLSSVTHALSISNNRFLTNIDALTSLTYIGTLNITNNPLLQNTDGLANVTDIERGIVVEDNDVLTRFSGLTNVDFLFGDLKFVDNPVLVDISGVSGLKTIGGELLFEHNAMLADISPLSNLISVDRIRLLGGVITNVDAFSKLPSVNSLSIVLCSKLENINGFSNMVQVDGGVIISTNSSLTELNGFAKIAKIDGNLWIEKNRALIHLDGLSNLSTLTDDLTITENTNLVDFCGLKKLFTTGTIGGTVTIEKNGASTVTIDAPDDFSVNTDPNACSAVISEATIGTAEALGCLTPGTPTHSDFPAGNVFPVGVTEITWTVTDEVGGMATAVQRITVVDNQNPVISCPAPVTVSCAADVPAADITKVSASDNCSATVSHVGDVITNQTCVNRFTLTRTYRATDPSGNSVTCDQVITVFDNTPPELTPLTVSHAALWPPNHKMRDLTVSYTASDNCSNAPTTMSITCNEPANGTGDGDTDIDWVIIDANKIQLRAERAANGDGRIYTITVSANDGCNPSVTKSETVRVTHNITGPLTGKPFKVGSTVAFSGDFWDKPGNTHTAKWQIDGSSVKGSLTEPTPVKNGKVSGSYKFTSPGIYKLQMNVTDQKGITSYANTNGDVEALVVVYDPNGGYTFGGGWFNSPAGALKSNPNATGKVSYGFTVNYYKGAAFPKGETQMAFRVGDFEYNALNFDYLVISAAKAQFKGTGKIIGGQSGINFIMTVVDGQLDGTGKDKVRLKIYNRNTGKIYYDNQPGASDADDPLTEVGTNSEVTIGGNNLITQAVAVPRQTTREMTWGAFAQPNPSRAAFNITVTSDQLTGRISLQVLDMNGRLVENRNNVAPGSTITLGALYRPGVYHVRVMQGSRHKELKLIKLPD